MRISLYQQPEILINLFLLCLPVELYPKILKLRCWSLTFTLYKAILKRDLELVPLSHFLHYSWTKIYLTLYLINWPNFIAWLPLLLEIMDNTFIVVICCPGCDAINFEINLTFLSSRSSKKLKSQKKLKISREQKELEIKSSFHHF